MGLKIKGGAVGSIKNLKKSLKRGGASFIRNVPKDDGITVRFLTEPPEWFEYQELYVEDMEPKFFPVVEGMPDEILARAKNKPSKRYLCCAVDTADNTVIALKMPKSLVESLMKKYNKYETIMDRDYELVREGDGLDTTYEAIPEAPRRMNISKFTVLDLEKVLEDSIPKELLGEDLDDDDDEDDEPIRRTPGARRSSEASSLRSKTAAAPVRKQRPSTGLARRR